MLKISRLADYATLILDVLARLPEGRGMSAAQLAEKTELGQPTVSKILKQLHEAQLVKSERGTYGGYALNKPAKDIHLAAVITAIDGRPALTECSHSHQTCQQNHSCTVRANWQLINFLMNDLLAHVNLEQMTQVLSVQSYARIDTSMVSELMHVKAK